MSGYDAWNQAIIEYFVQAAPVGAPIYLSADDDTLAIIGQRLPDSPTDGIRDFLRAVRARVLRVHGSGVDLDGVQGYGAGDAPRCVAFLATLVLAASRMGDDGAMDDVNYFGRLRELLGIPGDRRPAGMMQGDESEEPLWKRWNLWLQTQGYLSTAEPGDSVSQRYIHYARSQALLRDADKDKLRSLFQARGWRTELDEDALFLRVRREASSLTVHLREVLASDSGRQQALASAMHELYEAWRADPAGSTGERGVRGRTLYAGLYREDDPLAGGVSFYLLPRAPRGGATALCVQVGDQTHNLRPDSVRPGWFLPLEPVDGKRLSAGARLPIAQPAEMDALVLPRRDFWILIPDPEDETSGVYASWGAPRLAVPFVVLCRRAMLDQLIEMRRERLIEFSGEPVPVLDDDWVEVRDCLAVSEAWSAANLNNSELYDALRPADMCHVSASGGLRLSGGGGWLDSAGPNISIFGFEAEGSITVTRLSSNTIILERTQAVNQAVPVPWAGPGRYLIEATCGGQTARRMVTLISWDDVRLVNPERRETLTIGTHRVSGAALA